MVFAQAQKLTRACGSWGSFVGRVREYTRAWQCIPQYDRQFFQTKKKKTKKKNKKTTHLKVRAQKCHQESSILKTQKTRHSAVWYTNHTHKATRAMSSCLRVRFTGQFHSTALPKCRRDNSKTQLPAKPSSPDTQKQALRTWGSKEMVLPTRCPLAT